MSGEHPRALWEVVDLVALHEGRPGRALAPRDRIRLQLLGPNVEDYLEVFPSEDGRGIVVRAGSGRLKVVPRAGNEVELRDERNDR